MEQHNLYRFTVVLYSPAQIRIREDEFWQVQQLPLGAGSAVDIRLTGRYVDEGYSSLVPRGIRAEVNGLALGFDEAISAFGQSADFLSPLLALASNVYVPPFRYELAYEPGDGVDKRSFRQWFHPPTDWFVPSARRLPFEPLAKILEAHLQSHEAARIYRAVVQYQEALGSWQAGQELRAAMHLWMAVEAMTKAFIRRECSKHRVDENGLAGRWQIDKRRLDPEARRRLIFQGDTDTYKRLLDVSDGLEHMFQDFPILHAKAAGIRDAAATHIRQAIINLLGLPPEASTALFADAYQQPLTLGEGFVWNISGHLVGSGSQLARPGSEHPFFEGGQQIVDIERKDDTYETSVRRNVVLAVGSGIQFQPAAVGMAIPFSALETKIIKARTGEAKADG